MKVKTANHAVKLFGQNKMIKEQDGYRIAYDELTDTLYLSLGQPKTATESYLDENYILVRKIANKICGITIDGFLDRHEDNSWCDELITAYLPEFDTHILEDFS